MRSGAQILYVIVSVLCVAAVSRSEVIEFDEDQTGWEQAVGSFTTITFTGFPDLTLVEDQYSDLGIHFIDGNVIVQSGANINDGFGLFGGFDIHILFDTPQLYIAVEYPGAVQFQLFRNGIQLFESSNFGLSGAGHFAGLLSTEPFDEVIIVDWVDLSSVVIDDLHFGVPAPGALALLGLAGLLGRTRRRRE